MRVCAPARGRWVLAVLGLVAVLVTTGCSGVPRSSGPTVVKPVDNADTGDLPAALPTPGADPRTLISEFLAESAHSASGARQFLTVDAQRKWQASPIQIVSYTNPQLSTAVSPNLASVQVNLGTRMGQVDDTGVFTPALTTSSTGGIQAFGLKKVNGQWRIDTLPPGIVVTQSDFKSNYNSFPLYFFDGGEKTLVPDIRYSNLSDPQQLLIWLMARMLAGPRPELVPSVVNEIPDQTDPTHVTVTGTDPIDIDIPGISQVNAAGREHLAAQLAYTMSSGFPFSPPGLRLSDTNSPVQIPNTGSAFSKSDFPGFSPDADQPDPRLFFLRGGQLIDGATQKPVTGALGASGHNLTAVAVRSSDDTVQVVAVSGTDKVLIGTAIAGYTPVTGLPVGVVSRPSWSRAPGLSPSAWVGVGNSPSLYAINSQGKAQPIVITPLRGAAPQGRVLSLQFSPGGSRLAMLLAAPDHTQTVWIGSVVRSGTETRIEGFEPITPSSLKVRDVVWRDITSMFLVVDQSAPDPGIVSLSSDGSGQSPVSTSRLPTSPELIAAAASLVPVVLLHNGGLWRPGTSGEWDLLTPETPQVITSPVFSQ